MKVKNMIIALILMGVLTVLLLALIGIVTYYLGLQADESMLMITMVYILVGVFGGVAYSFLERIQMKRSIVQLGLPQRILRGVILGSVYMLILLLLTFWVIGENVEDWLRLGLLWLMVCGSCILGNIVFGRKA